MSIDNNKRTKIADAIAFMDDAGEKGFSKNFTTDRDDEIGLLCAIPVPVETIDKARSLFRPGYDRFLLKKPPKAKIHIAEAFGSGDKNWINEAHRTRKEYFDIMKECRFLIVYEARRARVERLSSENREKLSSEAQKKRKSRILVNKKRDKNKLETQLMIGLSLKLDCFAADFGRDLIDIHSDETNSIHAYRSAIKRTKEIGKPKKIQSTGFDPIEKKLVHASASIELKVSGIDFPLSVERVGDIHIVGKNDPLILAVDIVANSLLRHLRNLNRNSHLNSPSSIEGWCLESLVCGACEDGVQEYI